MTFNELDVVFALVPLESGRIAFGSVGTIVHVFSNPSEAYLVEFANDNGETLAMVTVAPDQIALADIRKAA